MVCVAVALEEVDVALLQACVSDWYWWVLGTDLVDDPWRCGIGPSRMDVTYPDEPDEPYEEPDEPYEPYDEPDEPLELLPIPNWDWHIYVLSVSFTRPCIDDRGGRGEVPKALRSYPPACMR